jgi:hypothetical protein
MQTLRNPFTNEPVVRTMTNYGVAEGPEVECRYCLEESSPERQFKTRDLRKIVHHISVTHPERFKEHTND